MEEKKPVHDEVRSGYRNYLREKSSVRRRYGCLMEGVCSFRTRTRHGYTNVCTHLYSDVRLLFVMCVTNDA